MVKSHPQISVIMAVYNGEKFLEEAIGSILKQTFSNFEFIIIDDGSEDTSLKIIKNFKDKRISILENNKNIGLSASLNKGIKLSKGKYIARMDADDISLPERLEKQYNFMERNPNIGIVGTGYHLINESGERMGTYIYPDNPVTIHWKLLTGPVFPHPTVMMRKKVLIENNLSYNEEYFVTQDYELWCRIIQFTEGSNFPEALIQYRHHDQSKSKAESDKQEQLRVKVSAESLVNIYQIPNLTTEQTAIIRVIVNSDISSLKKTDLEKVNKIFFHILGKFRKNISSSKSLINNWQLNYMLPLIIQLEKLLINTPLLKEEDRVLYLNYLFKLSSCNISVWFIHLFSEIKLFIYYPFWLIQFIKYLIGR